jgi:solute carrier family 25 protein 34/35
VGSAAQLVTYSYVMDQLARNSQFKDGSWQANVVGASLSGFVIVVVINRLDVVSTRIYNQPGQGRLYTGYADCVMKIIRTEGMAAFYKGLFAQYLRIGPHSFLSLIFWHHSRSWLGLIR